MPSTARTANVHQVSARSIRERARMRTGPYVVAASALLSIGFLTAPARAQSAPVADKGERKGTVMVRFGEGLSAQNADGSVGISLKTCVQVRGTAVETDDPSDASGDVQIRRLRLTIEGFAFRHRLTYKIQLAGASLDLDPVAPLIVRDAYGNFALHRDLEVRAGQMKVPFGRQRVVSSGNLQMVDRSIVTSEFNLDRDVGLQALSTDLFGLGGHLGYNLGVFGGDGRGRVSGSYGLLYAARIELRALGGTRAVELDEPDFSRSKVPRLAFGVSAAFNHKTDRKRSTLDSLFSTGAWASYAHTGFDSIFKFRGFSLTSEFFLRKAVDDTNIALVDGKLRTDRAQSGYGGFLQSGYFLTESAEVTARLGGVYPFGDSNVGSRPTREVGGGLSYYFFKHALKLQADYFRLLGEGNSSRHQVRLQLQFAP